MSDNNSCNLLKAKIVPLKKLLLSSEDGLYSKLRIPFYQRPYVWAKKQLSLLISDIYNAYIDNKSAYRIGTAILHEHNDEQDNAVLDIVDGQQRITTLMLILKTLDSNNTVLGNNLTFNSLSKANILRNIVDINSLIKDRIGDKAAFKEFLLSKCTILLLTISGEDKIDEVFQLFDSQNGRGKELEHYNLLKAYHIDAMHDDSKELKIFCDERWESSARYFPKQNERGYKGKCIDLLAQLLYEQLYRGRVWGRGENAGIFSRDNLEEFMGSDLKEIKHPYQFRLIPQIICLNIKNETDILINPFIALDQELLNGIFFFNYVKKYQELYKNLFLTDSKKKSHEDSVQTTCTGFSDFNIFYGKNCLYPGSSRRGDSYLRELYKTVVLYAIDRFGINDVVHDKVHEILYAAVYRIRLTQSSVYYESAMKYKEKLGNLDLFKLIKLSSDSLHCAASIKDRLSALGEINIVFRKNDVEAIDKSCDDSQVNPENIAIRNMRDNINGWLK